MGKRVVPPNDPERLALVMDEKKRMFGVDVNGLVHQSAEKKRAQQEEVDRQKADDRFQQLVDKELYKRRIQADQARRDVAQRVANQLREQIKDKEMRDEQLRQLFSNQLNAAFFAQFGTSHR